MNRLIIIVLLSLVLKPFVTYILYPTGDGYGSKYILDDTIYTKIQIQDAAKKYQNSVRGKVPKGYYNGDLELYLDRMSKKGLKVYTKNDGSLDEHFSMLSYHSEIYIILIISILFVLWFFDKPKFKNLHSVRKCKNQVISIIKKGFNGLIIKNYKLKEINPIEIKVDKKTQDKNLFTNDERNYFISYSIQILLVITYQTYTFGLYSEKGISLFGGQIFPPIVGFVLSSSIFAGFIKLLFRKKVNYLKYQLVIFLLLLIPYSFLIQSSRNSHISGFDIQIHKEMLNDETSSKDVKDYSRIYLKRYNKDGVNFFSEFRYPGEPFFSRPNRVKPKDLSLKDLITKGDILNSPELMYRINPLNPRLNTE